MMYECTQLVFAVSELRFICIYTKYKNLNPDTRADTELKCDIFKVVII
jgi:hypothetical protein